MEYIPIKPVPPPDVPYVHGRAPSAGNQWYGPFQYGGALWAIVEVGQPSTNYAADWRFAAMKSTDGGNTWSEVDQANAPIGNEVNSSLFPQISVGKVWIGYKKALSAISRVLVATYFDLAAGPPAWGTASANGPNPGGGFTGTKMVLRADGSYVLSTNRGTSSDTAKFPAAGVYYVKLPSFAGAWDTPVSYDLDPNVFSRQILLATADLTHFFPDLVGFSSVSLRHLALTSADALGALETGLASTYPSNAWGVPTIWSGKIVLPWVSGPSGGPYYPKVIIGDPDSSSTPSWSIEQITADVQAMPPFNSDNANTFAIVKDGDLYVFWVTPIPVYGSGGMNSIYYARRTAGVWEAPVLYHTEAADNPYQDWFHNLSVTLMADGTWGILVDRIHRTADANSWSVTGFLGQAVAAAARRSRVFYRKPFFPPR